MGNMKSAACWAWDTRRWLILRGIHDERARRVRGNWGSFGVCNPNDRGWGIK